VSSAPRRVVLLGATGTIGRATLEHLRAGGHEVVCLVRPGSGAHLPGASGMEAREVDFADTVSIADDGLRGERFDAVISCMASRTGAPGDAWAIDHAAHVRVLEAVTAAGVPHFVLLSAICVQKPRLEFQRAKLAFERALRDSGLRWSIVRATAFFKSISGQVARVLAGKPYLLFGDGRLNACAPIADEDLAEFLVGCLDDDSRWDRVLPIGGPGPALTPRDQGELIFRVAGLEPKYRSVPVGLLDVIVGTLSFLGRVVPPLRSKAELARIGRYYATESMLVWDEARGRYDDEATPRFGRRTLEEHYRRMVSGEVEDDRGAHAVFR
jgi:divinyl chlorophyllide a 8-vinyl-reductase